MTQFEHVGSSLHTALDFILGHTTNLQAIGHVVVNRHMRIKRIVLEHHRAVTILRFKLIDNAIPDHKFTTGDLFKTCHHTQERGFTTTRGPHDHDEFAIFNVEGNAMDNSNVTITLADIFKLNTGHNFSLTFLYQPSP